jgi:hypothetical protein
MTDRTESQRSPGSPFPRLTPRPAPGHGPPGLLPQRALATGPSEEAVQAAAASIVAFIDLSTRSGQPLVTDRELRAARVVDQRLVKIAIERAVRTGDIRNVGPAGSPRYVVRAGLDPLFDLP